MLGSNGFLPLVYESEVILKNVRPMEFCYDLKCPKALLFQLCFFLSLLLMDSHSCLDWCLITYKDWHFQNKKGSESESSDTLTLECSFHTCLM